jgi:3-hydroxyisobutyrate dehydrogenase
MSNGATPARTRIGWIGTGVMGRSMCDHLVTGGYQVTVHTRTRERAEPLMAAGADWADDPAEVAGRSDIVFTMLGYPEDVREVILGADGVLAAAAPGTIAVDLTTSDPSLAVTIGAEAASRGLQALDAPVSGGDVGAREGTLSIMAGGPTDAFERVLPCLRLMGDTIVHQGNHGAGQHTKMVNQTLIASNIVGVCEALLYAHRAGLDIDRVLASVSAGAAGSWSLSNLAPRMVARDLAPGFLVDHFVKDMGLALAEAERLRLALPGLALAHQLYVALQAQGHGRSGTQALISALAAVNGLTW